MNNNAEKEIAIDDFKEEILKLEKENLSKIKPDEKKKMVAKIMNYYESLKEQE